MTRLNVALVCVLALALLMTGILGMPRRVLALREAGGAEEKMPPFQVPPGFVVERVAGPPLLERPMMASFDDRGRLFVCDSSGFNLLKGSSDILVKDPPHC